MIILKVTKNQCLTLSVEDTFFEKPQGGGGQMEAPRPPPHPPLPSSRFRVKKYD